MKKEWDQFEERGSHIAIKLMCCVVRTFGRKNCYKILYLIIPYFFLFARQQRKNSYSYFNYLKKSGLKLRSTHIESFFHFYEFGCLLIDKIAVAYDLFNFEDLKNINTKDLRSCLENKNGAIVLGAHFGNLEIVNAFSKEFPDLVVHALMNITNSKNFRSILPNKKGLKILMMDTFAPAIFIELEKIINEGGIISMMADRPTPGAREKTLTIKLFEKEFEFPLGPWILTELLPARVFLAFSLRNKIGGYEIHVDELTLITKKEEKDRNLRFQKNAQQFADILERYVRLAPTQFFNFHQNWD